MCFCVLQWPWNQLEWNKALEIFDLEDQVKKLSNLAGHYVIGFFDCCRAPDKLFVKYLATQPPLEPKKPATVRQPTATPTTNSNTGASTGTTTTTLTISKAPI